MMPKLSIIVPTFNSGSSIMRCLESIARQTFKDYEVLIQDGMSTDNTVALIQTLGLEYPGMKLLVEQTPDGGVYDAMNKAIRRATGEWIYFIGSDDHLYCDTALMQILESPHAKESDALYGNVRMVSPAGSLEDAPVYDGRFTLRKLLRRNISHQAIFYRRELAETIGLYNTRYFRFADWDYNMRCWSRARFKYVDVVVAAFYRGGISDAKTPDSNFEAEVGKNVIRYFDLTSLNPLVNSPLFMGVNEIEQMQRAKSAAHHVLGSAIRYVTGILERAERRMCRAGNSSLARK